MESVKDYMDKKAVAQVLEQIAAFLELKSENPFRIRAFRTAARAIAGFPRDLRQAFQDRALDSA
jgi:DNA polymerase (family 10)